MLVLQVRASLVIGLLSWRSLGNPYLSRNPCGLSRILASVDTKSTHQSLCHFWADITIKPSHLRARTSSIFNGLLYTESRLYLYSAGHAALGDYPVVWSQLCCRFKSVGSRRLNFYFHYLIHTPLLYRTFLYVLLL